MKYRMKHNNFKNVKVGKGCLSIIIFFLLLTSYGYSSYVGTEKCLCRDKQLDHLHEYFYSKERLIHTLSSEKIFHILKSSAWKTLNQGITSAKTNNDRDIKPNILCIKAGENTCGVNAFADLKFDKTVKRVLDVGSGKYACCQDYVKKNGVKLLIWDHYNRPSKHNLSIQNAVMKRKVDAATSIAVLNVIAEPEVRLAHISTLKDALALNRLAYFKIWPGKGILKGSYIPTINSYGYPGYQSNAYADKFLREVQIVFGLNNAKLHESIPNLIVAIKKSNNPTSKSEIKLIQKLSLTDKWHFKQEKWLLKNYFHEIF